MFRIGSVLLLLLAGPAPAQVILPPAAPFGWYVGQADSTAHHWNVFSTADVGSYPGPFTPDQAVFAPGLPNATLTELTGTGFLTGGGNIYSPATVLNYGVSVPAYHRDSGPGGPWLTTVYIQTRTMGSEINYPALTLGWVDGGGPNSFTPANAFLSQELERVPLGGFGGFAVTQIWGFAVNASPANFTLNFGGAASSVSLDQLRIDTFVTTVPEPSSLVLVAVAGAAAFARRRRSA